MRGMIHTGSRLNRKTMKQFQVPQFITVEDKVVGPFTVKQFLFVAAGAIVIGVAYKFLKPFLFLPVAAVIGSLAAAFAFLKINETPFPVVVKNAFFYITRPRLYLWRQEAPKKRQAVGAEKKSEPGLKSVPRMSESKLSDLAWSLDIEERLTKE